MGPGQGRVAKGDDVDPKPEARDHGLGLADKVPAAALAAVGHQDDILLVLIVGERRQDRRHRCDRRGDRGLIAEQGGQGIERRVKLGGGAQGRADDHLRGPTSIIARPLAADPLGQGHALRSRRREHLEAEAHPPLKLTDEGLERVEGDPPARLAVARHRIRRSVAVGLAVHALAAVEHHEHVRRYAGLAARNVRRDADVEVDAGLTVAALAPADAVVPLAVHLRGRRGASPRVARRSRRRRRRRH